jgi:hypothetical protein
MIVGPIMAIPRSQTPAGYAVPGELLAEDQHLE